MIFQSIALDSFGGFGDEALDLLDSISDYATDRSPEGLTARDIRQGLVEEVSASIQRHNARMTQRWVVRQHRARSNRAAQRQLVAAGARSVLGLAPH